MTALHSPLTKVVASYYRLLFGMSIGQGSRIARSCRLDKTNPAGIVIGDYTLLSFEVAVLTHDFVDRRYVTTRIGSYCFIGARSVILGGVTIGDHSIVAAGSVVSSDVPAHCIVAGNPARIVSNNIQTSKWGIREANFLAANGDADKEAAEHKRLMQAVRSGDEPTRSPAYGRKSAKRADPSDQD